MSRTYFFQRKIIILLVPKMLLHGIFSATIGRHFVQRCCPLHDISNLNDHVRMFIALRRADAKCVFQYDESHGFRVFAVSVYNMPRYEKRNAPLVRVRACLQQNDDELEPEKSYESLGRYLHDNGFVLSQAI